MADTLRTSLVALVGLLAAAVLSQIEFVLFLFNRFALGSSPYAAHWSENYTLHWLRICLFITIACLLTAGALRFRFFALTVGTTLLALPVVIELMMYGVLAGRPDHLSVFWPSWPFELTAPALGCALIVIHFFHRQRSDPDPLPATGSDEENPAENARTVCIGTEQEPSPADQAVKRSVGASRT